MSYREVRDFIEIMRALGDPRVISMDNFQRPNFELVADCLEWLVHRYDPTTDIEADETSVESRVRFLKSVGQVMYTKARIKLNLKRLYAADGMAVKEMLKVAQLLYTASRQADKPMEDAVADGEGPPVEMGMSAARLQQLKDARQLTGEITQLGARLYDALGQQGDLTDAWRQATGLSTEAVAEQIQEKIQSIETSISNMNGMREELDRDETTLQDKLKKRREELERHEKRLTDMQRVRPAYMDEYERKQAELQHLYEIYVQRIRNLEFLESRIQLFRQQEAERLAKQQRQMERMRRRIQENEMRIRRGDNELEDGLEEGDEIEFDEEEGSDYETEVTSAAPQTMRFDGGKRGAMGAMVEDDESEGTELTEQSEATDVSAGEDGLEDEDEDDLDEEEEGSDLDGDIISGGNSSDDEF